MAAVSSGKSTILFFCTLEWLLTQFFLQCNQWFHDGLKFFFHYLLLLERKFGWALSPSRFSFLFVRHLEWSLNTSIDKISNGVCTCANFCPTLICVDNFLQEIHKRRRKKLAGKKLNVDRQFLKDVICIYWWYSL